MTISEHRNKIGNFILFANLGVFLLLFALFFLKGFTPEELVELLKFLIPIKSIYVTALIRYVIINKKNVLKEPLQNDIEILNPLYKNISFTFIYSHILLLALLFVMTAFNVITFASLTYFISIVEAFFGCYVGIFISDMFKVNGQVE